MRKIVLTLAWLGLVQLNHAATYVYNVPAAYSTIQSAVNAVPANSANSYIIQIAPGRYNEAVLINSGQNNITFVGTGADRTNTVIWNNILNSSNSYTGALRINGNDITVKNLTLQNTAGPNAGQANALYSGGQRIAFKNVLVTAYQDTALITGGPNYFCNSEVAGSVDFIWFGGTAYFENCTVRQLVSGDNTAPSTASNVLYGFVFTNCYIAKGPGVAANSSGLMRPYAAYGETAYLGCTMDDHITAAGWDAWNGNEATCRAAEYMSYTTNGTLIDLSTRSSWVTRLTAAQAAAYNKTNVLAGWNPPVSPTSYEPPFLPVIPANLFNVTTYGAIGNGATDNTTPIQNAINAANAAGGGTVEIPAAAGTYLCGPLTVTNNINLQIDTGAILQLLPYGTYPSAAPNFINGTALHDFEITGGGAIDGQGQAWWTAFQQNSSLARPILLSMHGPGPIELQGITMSNAPMFFIGFGTSKTTVEGVTINAPATAPNTDACDITGDGVLVENCNISNGDDDFTCEGGARNIMIRNNAYGTGHGLSIGSFTDQGGVSNFMVFNCSFNGTTTGVHIKTARDRGGEVQRCTYANLTMTNVQSPIYITEYYPDSSVPTDPSTDTGSAITATTPIFHDIVISNVTAVGATPGHYGIYGLPEMPITNVTLVNVSIPSAQSFACWNIHNLQVIDSTITSTAGGTASFFPYQAYLTFTNSTSGAGTVTLGGSTNQSNNSLLLYNAPASSRAVNFFATSGTLTVDGSTLAYSNNLTLGSGAVANFLCGTNVSRVNVTGNLTFQGTVNINGDSGFVAGSYVLFTYTGSLTWSPVLGSTPAGFTCSFDTSTAGQVKLVVTTGASPPAPPTGLAATGGNGVANLTWVQSTNNGITLNKVYRATAGSGGPYTLIATLSACTNYADANVQNSVSYWYEVTAVNVNGESGYSTWATATPAGPPSAPASLTAAGGPAQVQLTWTASPSATSYNVKRTVSNGGPIYVIVTNVASTSFSDTSVANGTTYYYVVSGVNGYGEGANSVQASATPSVWQAQDIGAVGLAGSSSYSNGVYTVAGSGADIQGTNDAFQFMYVTASGDCTIIVRVATESNPNVWAKAGVMIRETLAANAANAFIAMTPAEGATWQYRSSAGGSTSYNNTTGLVAPYWVKLVRSGNTFTGYRSPDGSTWTQQGTATFTMATNTYVGFAVSAHNTAALCTATFDNVTVPASPGVGIPANLTATPGDAQVSLNWNAVPGATIYNVKRATVSEGPYTIIASPATTNYLDAGLVNGTTYYYSVSAQTTNGTGADCPVATATPLAPPAAPPTGLTATAGNAQVTLNWNSASGATSYNIKRATVNGGPYTTVTNVAGTSYTDAGLANGTTYYYVVSAVNYGGESANSAQVSATPMLPVPDMPTGLTANPGNARVTVSWMASSLATSYNVKRATVSGGPYVTVTNVTTTSDTDTGLANGTAYYYVVSAVNSSGESANSTQVSGTPVAPPSAPTGVAATGGIGQVSVSWNAASGATVYNVKRATTSGGPYAIIGYASGTSYTDSSGITGVTYYYVVSGSDAGGEGPDSAEVSAQCGQALYQVNSGGVALGTYAADAWYSGGSTWGNSDTINTNQVQNPAPMSAYQTERNGNFSYTFTNLVAGTTYKVRLHFAEIYFNSAGSRTFNVAINGTQVLTNFDIWSAAGGKDIAVVEEFMVPANGSGQIVIQYTTVVNNAKASAIEIIGAPPNQVPAAPAGLTATAGDSQVTLSWNASSGASSYNVKRATVNGGPYTTVTNVTTPSYSDTGLVDGTTYYYVVSALNAAGESGNSTQASATPQVAPPAAPTGLIATPGNSQVGLSWTASSGASSYNVKRATVNGGPYTTVANVSTASYSDTGLVNGTTYYYVVSALNAGGESANSTQASATPQVPPPAAPTGLTATPGNSQVSLSWTASSGASSYNVKRATVNGGPYTTLTNVASTSYSDTGLVNGTTYYYVVSALNAGGESANSTQASATPVTSLPSPWQNQDIGTVGIAGGASDSNGVFTVSGAGAGIGGTADAFQFVYQPSTGNCTNTVRVASIQNTGSAAKAGVMIRDTLNANAMAAGVWVTPSSIVFTYRTSTGGNTSTKTSSSKTAPYWVRITRSSNAFSAYYSANGTSWTQIGGTQTISMGTSAYIGLGVCSGTTNALNTATIDNVLTVP